MRRQRRKKNWGLPALLILVIVIIGGGFYLIHRGAKVQGPNDIKKTASTSVIDTTPKTTTGAYRTSTTTTAGETVKILVQLKAKHRFARQIVTTGNDVVLLVDSGTYTKKAKQLTLSSTSAVRCTYATTSAYDDATPIKMTRYGGEHADYPQALSDTLNNRLRLKSGQPTSYENDGQWLKLHTSTDTVDSVTATVEAQDTSTETTTDTTPAYSESQDTTASIPEASSSSQSVESSASSQSSDSSDADAASSSSSAALTPEQAQAAIAQRYPSDQYTITANGEANGVYTFTVTNIQTSEQQTVTVSASGQ
jgi:hypothetical protein